MHTGKEIIMHACTNLAVWADIYLTLLLPKKLVLRSSDQEVLAMSKPLHAVLEVIPNASLVMLEYERQH